MAKCYINPSVADIYRIDYDMGTSPQDNEKINLIIGHRDSYAEFSMERDKFFGRHLVDAMIRDLNNPLHINYKTGAIYQGNFTKDIGIARNVDNKIIYKEDGKIKWIDNKTGEEIDPKDYVEGDRRGVKTKNDAGQIVSLPNRFPAIQEYFLEFFKRGAQDLGLTSKGLEDLENGFITEVQKILNGDAPLGWEQKWLALVVGEGLNKAKVFNAFFTDFNHILTNEKRAKEVFGISFKEPSKKQVSGFRRFAETLAARSGHNIGADLNVFDLLTEDQRAYLASKDTIKWHNADGSPHTIPYTRKDFEHITFEEGYDIIAKAFPDIQAGGIDKFSAMMNVKVGAGLLGRLDYHFRNVLLPSLYMLAMGIGVPYKSLAALTSINAMLYVSDWAHKTHRGILSGDWSQFMKRHGFKFTPYIDHLDWSPENIGATMVKYTEKLKGFYDAGFFNISDGLFEQNYYAKRLSYYFKNMFPSAKNVADIERQLTFLKQTNPEQAQRLLEDAYTYMSEAVRKESTNTIDYTKNKVIHATESMFWQKGKNLLMRTYNFMMGWARAKTRGAKEILESTWTHFRTPVERQWLEMMQNPNIPLEEVNLWRHKMIAQNEDIIDFFTKFQTSAYISKMIERSEERGLGENDKEFMQSFWDIMNLMANFNGTLAAFTLLPEWKIFSAFARNIFKDVDGNGRRDMDFGKGLLEATEVSIKTMARGFWVLRGAVNGLGMFMNDPSRNSLMDFGGSILKGISNVATGYAYFLDNDIQSRIGFSKHIPQTSTSIIKDMLGVTPKVIQDYRDLYADRQKDKAFNGGFRNYLLYHLPFLAEYNRGTIGDKTQAKEVLQEMYNSQEYASLIKGELPEFVKDDSFTYLYNIATAVNLNGDMKLGKDLHTEFRMKDGDINNNLQTPENIWNELMKRKVDPERIEDLRISFGANPKTYQKQLVRLLGYLDAREPGTSALALAWLMQQEMVDYKYENYGSPIALMKDSEEKKIKAEIGKKYAEFFFEADKHRVWSNFMLHIMKDTDLKIKDHLDVSEYGNMKIKLKENSEYGDRDIYDAYKMNLLSHTLAIKGDFNAHRIANIFSDMFKPTKGDRNADGSLKVEFSKRINKYLASTLDRIDTFGLTNLERDAMKMGVLYSSFEHVSNVIRSGELHSGYDEAFQKLAHHLWGTLKEVEDITEELAQEESVAERSYARRGTYSARYPKYNKELVDSVRAIEGFLRDMAKKMTPYRDFSYRNEYGDRLYYSKEQFEKILSKGLTRESFNYTRPAPRSKNFGKQETPGGFTNQHPGFSRPKGGKVEDPDKTFDFGAYGRLKRFRNRIAKVKSLAQDWRRVNKLGGASDPTQHRRQRPRKSKGKSSK